MSGPRCKTQTQYTRNILERYVYIYISVSLREAPKRKKPPKERLVCSSGKPFILDPRTATTTTTTPATTTTTTTPATTTATTTTTSITTTAVAVSGTAAAARTKATTTSPISTAAPGAANY